MQDIKNLSKKSLGLVLVVILVVGLGSFYGGIVYSKSKNNSTRMMNPNLRAGQFGGERIENRSPRNIMNGGGFTAGEIISKDDKMVTIKLQNGGSKIVFVGESTKVLKSAQGTFTDLVVGQLVTVNGTPNTDGSVTAESIQLRPEMPKTQPQ